MLVEEVVVGPEQPKGRNGDEQQAARLEERKGVANCRGGAVQMLENVEHQDEQVELGGAKRLVKGRDHNLRAMRTGGVNQICSWLDAFHDTKLLEAIEKESVAATDIQDSQIGARTEAAAQHMHN